MTTPRPGRGDRRHAAPSRCTPGRRPIFSYNWWRYIVSLVAILFAIFPIVYVVSAAFNPIPSLTSAQLIPDHVTLENFRRILSGHPGEAGDGAGGARRPVHELVREHDGDLRATAFFSVFFGALAAYAFARFRFRAGAWG